MEKCGECEYFDVVSGFERTGICQYKGFRTMEHKACEKFEEVYIHDTVDEDDLWEEGYYGC